jgi:surfeit locus 1 family protein
MWTFNPGLIPTLATLTIFPLLLTLGFWQLDRAEQKQAIFDDYIKTSSRVPSDINEVINQGPSDENIVWRHGVLAGSYVDTKVLLLDNQVLSGTAGYHVYQPFQASGTDQWILINRGWVGAGSYRDTVPEFAGTEGPFDLTGVITAFPSAPGIVLDDHAMGREEMTPQVVRLQMITRQTAEQILGHTLFPYVFRLGADSPSGLVREWPQPGSGKERHLGYAFQWFSLAVVLLVIYISLNLRRRNP